MTQLITHIPFPQGLYSGVEIRRNVVPESGPVEYRYTGMVGALMDINTATQNYLSTETKSNVN
jgi:hypothetical protein